MRPTYLHYERDSRTRRRQSGYAIVEFLFMFMFWVIMVIGILEMVFFLHTYNVLADSAKEGVRMRLCTAPITRFPVGQSHVPTLLGRPHLQGPSPVMAPALEW